MNKKVINLDPFNEFNYLESRQQSQLKHLNENRHLIDSRISDGDIMMLYDMGIDAVSFCREKVHQYDIQIND